MEKCQNEQERMNMLAQIFDEMKSIKQKRKIVEFYLKVFGQNFCKGTRKKFDEILKGSEDNMILAMERNMIKERRELVRESRKKGITQGKIEIAQKLLKMKMPIEQIIEVTGIEKEKIEKMKKFNMQKNNN